MKWPDPSDYQEAVQYPQTCFHDQTLRAGKLKLNQLGLPNGISGNFAIVYEIHTGAQRWAVRCFLRQVTDQQERYDLLSQHMAGLWLPTLVGFEYLPQGIRVHRQWYPAVKMEWVDGEPFHIVIERHLNNKPTLFNLARQWRGLLAGLRGLGLAHGDLQHGNVLIEKNGQMRLVDYDGMFMPALSGRPSLELGHPNYQHPQRDATHYDERLDNFAAIVIYTSLLALAADPGLWSQFNTGENLILSAADYQDPSSSAALRRLGQSPDADVRHLAAQLENFCRGPATEVPDLEKVLAGLPAGKPQSMLQSSAVMPPAIQPTQVAPPVSTGAPRARTKWLIVAAVAILVAALAIWQAYVHLESERRLVMKAKDEESARRREADNKAEKEHKQQGKTSQSEVGPEKGSVAEKKAEAGSKRLPVPGQLVGTCNGHTNIVYAAAWSPDGRKIASGSLDKTIRIWDAKTYRPLATLTQHTGTVPCVAWSPDGRKIASGSFDRTIKIWDAESYQLVRTMIGHKGDVYSVTWSPNGRWIASGSEDGIVKIWDTQHYAQVKTLTGHTDWVLSSAWSPDSKRIATGSQDSTVKIWDADSARCIETLTGHTTRVQTVAWSPDGRRIASGSKDGIIRVWNTETYELIPTSTRHAQWVRFLAWSPNGRWLASGGADNTIKIWNAQNYKLIKTFPRLNNYVHCVAWSPDSLQIAGSVTDTVRIWGIER